MAPARVVTSRGLAITPKEGDDAHRHVVSCTTDLVTLIRDIPLLVAPEVPGIVENDRKLEWGRVAWHDSSRVGAAFVDKLALRTRVYSSKGIEPEILEARMEIEDYFPSWISDVLDWIQAYSQESVGDSINRQGIISEAWTIPRETVDISLSSVSSRLNPQAKLMSVRDLEKVGRRVTMGKIVLPKEYLILNQARAALDQDDFRKAVLESGTVIEVALFTLISKTENRKSVLGSLYLANLESYAGMQKLHTVASRVTGQPLPKSLTKEVIKVRNQTTHKQAMIPRFEQARASVDAVRDILDLVNPLPPLT